MGSRSVWWGRQSAGIFFAMILEHVVDMHRRHDRRSWAVEGGLELRHPRSLQPHPHLPTQQLTGNPFSLWGMCSWDCGHGCLPSFDAANTRPIPPSAVGAAGLPPNLRRPTLLALHFCWQFQHPPFCSRPHLLFLANTPPLSYHSSKTSPGPLPFGISSKKMTKSLFLPPSTITLSFLLPSELATGMKQHITRTQGTQQSIRLNDLRTNDATTNNRSKNN